MLTRSIRIAKFYALPLAVLFSVQLRAQSPGPVTLVKAGRLLDPHTGNVLTPAFVQIEGNKVKRVGSSSQIGVPADAKVIDLGSATLLPGLIDGHTHLFLDIIIPPKAESMRHNNGVFAPGLLLAIVESAHQTVPDGRGSSARRFGERHHNCPQPRPLGD